MQYTVMKYHIIMIHVYCICWKIAFELFVVFCTLIWDTVPIPVVMGSSSAVNLRLHHIWILSMIRYFTQNTAFLKLPVFGGVHLEPLHWLRIALSIETSTHLNLLYWPNFWHAFVEVVEIWNRGALALALLWPLMAICLWRYSPIHK